MQFRSAIRYPKTAQPKSMTARQVAAAYNFPMDKATGKGCTVAIIELGGGYIDSQVTQWFTREGLIPPSFSAMSVDGAQNAPDGPDGADGEVQLDMLVAGSIAPGARYKVYFCPNTDAGFLAGIEQALQEGCNVISISWGGPENQWSASAMKRFDAALARARVQGVPVFVAAGDTGSQDSSGAGNQCDFPASSPNAIGCGGTRLTLATTGTRAAEVVWDDNPIQSATGGGVSKQFPGRDVPDVAGNADPDTGYEISVDGQAMVVGGTSAVAPLMAGLYALLWELTPQPFDFLNLIVTNPQACYDVTIGDNGGYRAGPGRDETTGFGVPDGAALLAALTSGIPAPVPPQPAPPPAPAPSPGPVDPMADFPVAAVEAWGQHKHNYSHVEANAYTAIVDWAQTHGVALPPHLAGEGN